ALSRKGHPRAAAGSALAGAVAASALAASTLTADTGLYQRLGLTVVDTWFAVTALWLLGRREVS
nr:hypothetical protein [Actinomycetota bacterium]